MQVNSERWGTPDTWVEEFYLLEIILQRQQKKS